MLIIEKIEIPSGGSGEEKESVRENKHTNKKHSLRQVREEK